MDAISLSSSVTAVPSGDGIAKPKNAPEAAQQFEALLLAQMLRTAHTQEDGQDSTTEATWDMAAQQFAQVLSKNGGFGLAQLINGSLERKS